MPNSLSSMWIVILVVYMQYTNVAVIIIQILKIMQASNVYDIILLKSLVFYNISF